MKTVNRLISLLLALILLLGCLPVSVLAAEAECSIGGYSSDDLLEVTEKQISIRSGPGKDYPVLAKIEAGTVLEKHSTKINKYLNKWYKITYADAANGRCVKGYVYDEYVAKHSHDYESFTYDGTTYRYCDCGKIVVRVKMQQKKADAMAIAGVAAGTLSGLDGPVPVGDTIGVGLLITVGLLAQSGVLPSTAKVQSVYMDLDLEKVEKENKCNVDSYRKVSRDGGTLTVRDNRCMSLVEAYVWVRTGNHVWTQYEAAAAALGSVHKNGTFSEIDGSGKDYWYHYHLGQKTDTGKHVNVVGGHIFYGRSAITGKLPIGV